METPLYKVLQDSFMEPNPVKAGSIVRTWGPPGPHLEPLNDSARQKMEEWYEEEFDEIDVKTGKPTGKKERPHLKFRVRSNYASPTDRHSIEIVSGPAKDQPGSLSLAETLANPRQATDQRPGPLAQFRQAPAAAIPGATSPDPAPKPAVSHPQMWDEKGREPSIGEPPREPPEELPPQPTTSPTGNLTAEPPPSAQTPTESGQDGMGGVIPAQPEPERTDVVFSAPPPSAKRIG